MPQTNPNDGGLSSPGSICWVSPADLAGQVNNLLSRVSNLESILNQLLGVDITTLSLSDITNDLGNILAGSISLAASGDGSYPNAPGNFTGTIVSGNVTTVWNNGVVSFQVTPSGVSQINASSQAVILAGASVPAAPMDYGRVEYNNSIADVIDFRGTSLSLFSYTSAKIEIDVSEDGLYAISSFGEAHFIGAHVAWFLGTTIEVTGDPAYGTSGDAYDFYEIIDSGHDGATVTLTRYVFMNAGDRITVKLRKTSTPTIGTFKANVVKLSG